MSAAEIKLSQQEVEAQLRVLGIAARPLGQLTGMLRFASFREPCTAGIYFLEGKFRLPDAVSQSLILASAPPEGNSGEGNAWLLVDKPQLAFYRLMRHNHPALPLAGVHPTAIIADGARLAGHCEIGPYCIVEANVEIGEGCRLDSHVVVKSGSVLGARVVIEPHSTIGATGVAWAWDEAGAQRVMQPQQGGVRVGDDAFIGSDVSIVRGSVNEDTLIGDGTVIAHGSKIGHGCRLGRQVHLANNISLAGNVDLGDRVFLGSGAIVRPRVRIAEDVVVGAGSVVIRDVATPGTVVYGVPARAVDQTKERYSGVPSPR